MGLWSWLVLKEKPENRSFNKKSLSFDFICPYLSNLDNVKNHLPTHSCVTRVMAAQ